MWERVYRTANAVALGFAAYLLALPILSPFAERLMPSLWACPYRRLTGHPCPFCGITTDVGRIYAGDAHHVSLNALSTALFAFLVFQVLWRVGLAIALRRSTASTEPNRFRTLLGVDAAGTASGLVLAVVALARN